MLNDKRFIKFKSEKQEIVLNLKITRLMSCFILRKIFCYLKILIHKKIY